MTQRTWLAAIALVVLVSGYGEAHHSLAATYRLTNTQTIEGIVVKVALREPHSFVHIEALDGDGVMRRWSVEWVDVAHLIEQGITRDTLRVGERVRIVGHPGRDEDTYRLLVAQKSRSTDGRPGESE